MLSEIRIGIECDQEIGYYQASNMQGILMELIDRDYAEKLHTLNYNPYAQSVIGRDEKEWVIKTTTAEAFDKLIKPVINMDEFEVKKKQLQLHVKSRELKQCPKHALLEEFYSSDADRRLEVDFLTPTSFKKDGKYAIFPTVRLVFQSAMNKYAASSEEMDMFDEDTMEQIEKTVEIKEYRLKSCFFPLEGIRIPAFMGKVVFYVHGTETMAKYARLLLRFADYSGIGIKNSMGMGMISFKGRGVK